MGYRRKVRTVELHNYEQAALLHTILSPYLKKGDRQRYAPQLPDWARPGQAKDPDAQ